MENVLVILNKEWLELRQQRGLILSIVLPPFIFTVLPIVLFYLVGHSSNVGPANISGTALASRPELTGLSNKELVQAYMGIQFTTIYLLLPTLIPSIIASYSIVGEKTSRT